MFTNTDWIVLGHRENICEFLKWVVFLFKDCIALHLWLCPFSPIQSNTEFAEFAAETNMWILRVHPPQLSSSDITNIACGVKILWIYYCTTFVFFFQTLTVYTASCIIQCIQCTCVHLFFVTNTWLLKQSCCWVLYAYLVCNFCRPLCTANRSQGSTLCRTLPNRLLRNYSR